MGVLSTDTLQKFVDRCGICLCTDQLRLQLQLSVNDFSYLATLTPRALGFRRALFSCIAWV